MPSERIVAPLARPLQIKQSLLDSLSVIFGTMSTKKSEFHVFDYFACNLKHAHIINSIDQHGERAYLGDTIQYAFEIFFGARLGYFVFALHWIGFAFLVDAKDYLWMMPFAVGGLAAAMAVYWGLGFVLVEALLHRGWQRWLVWPCVIAVMEALRGVLFTGFPWAAPGLIADGLGAVLQLASLVGMQGLTLLVLLWGMLPGLLFLSWRQKQVPVILPALVLLSGLAAWGWGEVRLANHPLDNASGPVIRLVQPNIAQDDKWQNSNGRAILDQLLALSVEAESPLGKPQIIIWPESAVPFLLDEEPTALAAIAANLTGDQKLLTGTLRRDVIDGDERYYTSILGIDRTGAVFSRYDKWRLVPGGEYLPLSWLLEPLGFRKVVALPESFTPGVGPQVVDVPGVGPAAMLVCYEAIFPDHIVPVNKRPRWIVNVTNDGWFGRSIGPYQHLAQVRMRAVEQGLPVARAANTGVSAMIDPLGRITASTSLLQRGKIDARLPSALEPTLYSRAGIVPACLLLLFCLFLARTRPDKNLRQA
jgi:apolipoprotein N-acyltransferase